MMCQKQLPTPGGGGGVGRCFSIFSVSPTIFRFFFFFFLELSQLFPTFELLRGGAREARAGFFFLNYFQSELTRMENPYVLILFLGGLRNPWADTLWRYVGSLPTWIFDSRIEAEKKKGSAHSSSDSNTIKKRLAVAKVKERPCAMCMTRTDVTSAHIL